MKVKKILAVALAAAMVMGSTVTAYAEKKAEGSGTGSGTMAGYLENEVFNVVLPTMSVDDRGEMNSLKFLIDPQKLITASQGDTLPNGASFDPGKTMYFSVTTGGGIRYTDTSDTFTVINKSTMDTDITVRAEVSNLGDGSGKIKLSDDRSFSGDTAASMYMAIRKVGGAAVPISENGASLTGTIGGKPEAYKVSVVSGGGFMLTQKRDFDDSKFERYMFQVTGASNANGDWSGVYNASTSPSLTLTWTIVPHVDSYLDKTTISALDPTVTATLPDGVTVRKIVVSYNGLTAEMTEPTYYTKNGSTYTFVPEKVATWIGGTITFTYSDGHADILTIQ